LSVYVSSVPIRVSWGMGEREVFTAEIMEFEFQVFRKFIFVTEDNPSETSVHETVFVAGTCVVRGLWEMVGMGGYVLMLLTRGISKPNFTEGVAKGQNIAPLAPSTWMGMSRPVSS